MVLTREGPEIFQCLVLALELLDPLLGLRGHVVFVGLQGAVSEECVVSHLLAFAAHRLSVEPFTPSSSDRSSTVIPPGRDRLCRRYLELPAVSLSPLGRIERLSFLTWCPIHHIHSNLRAREQPERAAK